MGMMPIVWSKLNEHGLSIEMQTARPNEPYTGAVLRHSRRILAALKL